MINKINFLTDGGRGSDGGKSARAGPGAAPAKMAGTLTGWAQIAFGNFFRTGVGQLFSADGKINSAVGNFSTVGKASATTDVKIISSVANVSPPDAEVSPPVGKVLTPDNKVSPADLEVLTPDENILTPDK